jgi:amino acid transporter
LSKRPRRGEAAPTADGSGPGSFVRRVRRFVFGAPRDLRDRNVLRHLSVVAFLAWVGLGADGISSSAYGPEEAFRTLGEHVYLAVPMALAMIVTVSVISACYSRIIERFPEGGGGYVVATALLGPRAGVVSGAALLVDYVLTITISIAAAGDALFSFLPPEAQSVKLPVEVGLILLLTTLNIRGVKESILALLPVFLLFLATHAVLIVGGILAQAPALPEAAREVGEGFRHGTATLGLGGLLLLFVHAYSLGGGTYTGIEAVSNGLPIMREPRVQTAKRTMLYMALSLALTAAGLIVCYLLWRVETTPGKTLNAVLSERVAGRLGLGETFVVVTLVSEGALLVVAAQAGFLDGPRVVANMAVDGWAPRRFAALSDRLTTRNGVVLMGAAALAALLYTGGDVRAIVVMYSINVFLTFTLSMLGMTRAQAQERRAGRPWQRRLALFLVGLVLCATVLVITVVEKFGEGGWLTLAITLGVVLACLGVKRHYRSVQAKLGGLYAGLLDVPPAPNEPLRAFDPTKPTAAVLVGGYSGLGVHTTLAGMREFPAKFQNVVFLSVGVIDSNAFKSDGSLERLRERTDEGLDRYVALARRFGVPATRRSAIGTDVVSELERLCRDAAADYPLLTFFAGQLVFRRTRWLRSLLHNETAFALQRRLQEEGRTLVILPARAD